jgi:hypothetical protein
VSAQGVFWESYTAVLMLCNALITAVGLATPDAAESRLKLLEEVNTIAYNKKEEDLL